MIMRAELKDLQEILELQYQAYQSEAILLNDFQIQPLTQTLEEMTEEYQNGVFYKAVDENGKIIGSVRGRVDNSTLYIGKLMVHPSYRGQGIGSKLLQHIEAENPHLRKELYTSSLSENNLRLYEKNGYKRFQAKPTGEGFSFVYLEKE